MDNSFFDEMKMAENLNFEKDTILRIIIGFGGRLCLEKALSNSLHTLRVIVWEPDAGSYNDYCERNDLEDILMDKRLTIVAGEDTDNLKRVLRENIKDYNVHHIKVVSVGKYINRNDPYVETMVGILKEIIQPVANAEGARKKFHLLPCKNFIYTINSLDRNYIISQLLDNIGTRDIPIVIVAAGPSLMKNCSELKRASGKAIIIAVTHAMKTLRNNDIMPDLVAVTDPKETGFIDFGEDKQYTILSSVYADDKCRNGYDGRIIYYGFNLFREEFSVERTLAEADEELDTGSVATDIFSIFVTAGFKNIILVGQDLAYDSSGYSHTGFESDINDKNINDNNIEADGINGEKVRTRSDWEFFRKYFEKVIEHNKDIQVIDATEGGALIKGTLIMSLADTIDKYCNREYPINEWIKKLKGGDQREKEYIDEWFDLNIYNLKKTSQILDEAVSLNESVRKLWNNPELWDDDFRNACRRYDVLYSQIMEGTAGELLRFYCTEVIQTYLENALAIEGDENIENRMVMEYELFSIMKDKSGDLFEYIHNLRDQRGI
ncbi:MAG: DUF115 domain-containing protein [Lachnospiraceae bacterium]|nr:DUF115 domain-containing protein [Lachnospiraceae bacterium]